MDEIVRQLLLNSPTTALLAIMLWKVYGDWQHDRDIASAERNMLISTIEHLNDHLDRLAETVKALEHTYLR